MTVPSEEGDGSVPASIGLCRSALTSRVVVGRVDTAVDIRGDDSSQVSDSLREYRRQHGVVGRQKVTYDLEGHSYSTLGLSREVVAQPGDDGGNSSVRSCGAEEQSEELEAHGTGSDVDHESDEAEGNVDGDEEVTLLEAIGAGGETGISTDSPRLTMPTSLDRRLRRTGMRR